MERGFKGEREWREQRLNNLDHVPDSAPGGGSWKDIQDTVSLLTTWQGWCNVLVKDPMPEG